MSEEKRVASLEKRSEYPIQVFISSACYALVDLRAELASHLRSLGYDPVLSDEYGFPGAEGCAEPWESCLPVLQNCPIAIFIIDGGYGASFDWSYPSDFVCEGKVSPTHAEFLYARQTGRMILVFVREHVVAHYQTYREWKSRIDSKEAGTSEPPVLPPQVELKTLEFVEQVKTTRPIPWVIPFTDVTDIKASIQKQLMNELARHLATRGQEVGRQQRFIEQILGALSQVSEDERQKVLKGSLEHAIKWIIDTSGRLEKAVQERDEALEDAKSKGSKQTKALEKKLAQAQADVEKAKKDQRGAFAGAMFTLDEPIVPIVPGAYPFQVTQKHTLFGMSTMGVCDGCDVFSQSLRRCTACGLSACWKCNPIGSLRIHVGEGVCSSCGLKKK